MKSLLACVGIWICGVILQFPSGVCASPLPERRVWRDVQENILVAEYYGLTEDGQVRLLLEGDILTFPLVGFSSADQQWIEEQEAKNQPQLPTTPEGHPGVPRSLPAVPSSTLDHDTAPMANGLPAANESANESLKEPSTLDILKQQSEAQETLSLPLAPQQDFTTQLKELEANNKNRRSAFCRRCRTHFPMDSGLGTGNLCPHCSSIPFEFSGRMIRALIVFAALFVGLIGWSLKKMFQEPPSPRKPTYQY